MSTPSSSTTIWAHRELSFQESDLTGYKVEAQDGSIGKIDDATYQVGADHIVVDTGPWILGKKVMIPAGLIERIDGTEEKVYVPGLGVVHEVGPTSELRLVAPA